MRRRTNYEHAFVDTFSTEPEAGVLYVSLEFATTMHLCMCGCGDEVIAPLDPTDWTAHFDGRTVSLTPSIGNWALQCESHYVLTRGNVRWAARWSKAQVEAGRANDRAAKQHRDDTTQEASRAQPRTESRPAWVQRWWASVRGR